MIRAVLEMLVLRIAERALHCAQRMPTKPEGKRPLIEIFSKQH
jgi:hypothetical protein